MLAVITSTNLVKLNHLTCLRETTKEELNKCS